MSVRWARSAAVAVLAIFFSSCNSSTVVMNPLPLLTCITGNPSGAYCALFPTGITAGSQNFTLYVLGDGFISTANGNAGNSVAYWNGSPRPTFYNVNTSQLQVTIYASDVATAGQAQVQVINPAPGGGQSNFVSFFIHAPQQGAPVLTSVSPSTTASGGKAFNLTLTGSNFAGGNVVTWNGSSKATTFTSATQLTAAVTPTDIASPGCASVAVTSGAPGGPASVSLDVLVTGTGAPTNCTSTPSGSGAVFPRVVSLSAHGYAANGSSFSPQMSADGRFVAFYSNAKNLVSGAFGNIFVRDTCLGAAGACKPRTFAVDLAPDGSGPNGSAGDQLALSADGRYALFSSYATNLAVASNPPSVSPISSLYIRDLCLGHDAPAGCSLHTELVSVASSGEPGNNSSISPSLSADGRFAAFASWATNLVSGTSGSQIRIFVRDLCNGASASASCIAQTFLVPQANEGTLTASDTDHPFLSADGRYVAFQQWVPRAGSSNLDSIVFLRDMCLGLDAPASCSPSTTKISVAPDDNVLSGVNEAASVSSDGRFVVFASQPESASSTDSFTQAIYLRDTCLGRTAPDDCLPSTVLIATGADSGLPYSPWIAPGGRYISFLVGAPNSNSADPAARDGIVYVYDTCFGSAWPCTAEARPLTSSGSSSSGLLAADKFTPVPLTADGRFAAFFSAAHAPAQPAGGFGDVFQAVTSR
jgi:hypothetical protein